MQNLETPGGGADTVPVPTLGMSKSELDDEKEDSKWIPPEHKSGSKGSSIQGVVDDCRADRGHDQGVEQLEMSFQNLAPEFRGFETFGVAEYQDALTKCQTKWAGQAAFFSNIWPSWESCVWQPSTADSGSQQESYDYGGWE